MLWIVQWQLVKRYSVCSCQNQLCTRICVRAMIGLLKKPLSICESGWKESLTPFSGYFLRPLGARTRIPYYLGIRLCLLSRLCSYKKSWRQFLNDINDAYDHQRTLFLLTYVCTIPVFSWMIDGAIIWGKMMIWGRRLFLIFLTFQSFFHHW